MPISPSYGQRKDCSKSPGEIGWLTVSVVDEAGRTTSKGDLAYWSGLGLVFVFRDLIGVVCGGRGVLAGWWQADDCGDDEVCALQLFSESCGILFASRC